tara:strand:- start:645 stop:875 length:231 start_codon:yes stop_codon:yes gene_type:complete
MAMPKEKLIKLIKNKIPDAEFDIKDLKGDDNHFHATIKSEIFNGLSKVEQHKLVYQALGSHMGTTLHALMLTTLTK